MFKLVRCLRMNQIDKMVKKEKCAYLRIWSITFTYRIAIVIVSRLDMARTGGRGSDMEGVIFP